MMGSEECCGTARNPESGRRAEPLRGDTRTLSDALCPDMDALMLTAASELSSVPASCCTFGVAISLDVVQHRRSIVVEGVDRTVGLRERFYFVSRAAHSSFLLSICL